MKKSLIIILFLLSVCSAQPMRVPLTSFNAGELSPYLQTRSDFGKYQNGCKTLINMIPLSQGPVMRRPGTEYIAETETMTERSRLIPFVFSITDSYILEFGDLYMRVYRNGGQVQDPNGTENLGSPNDLTGNTMGHWKLNDDAANTTVTDSSGNSHNGTSSTNTANLSVTGMTNDAFDMDGQYYVTVSDDDDFTFDDSADEGMSVMIWINIEHGLNQWPVSKRDDTNGAQAREWWLEMSFGGAFAFVIFDETNNVSSYRWTNSTYSEGWTQVIATYDGRGGSDASAGITIYINGVDSTGTVQYNDPTYVQMRNTATDVIIGGLEDYTGSISGFVSGVIDNVAIFDKELTQTEVDGLYDTSGVYSLTTTYTDEEVSDLQYVQLADTMYITHANHEPRKLTRSGHTDWAIADVNYIDGPFIDENTDTDITVTPSATTGTITLDSNSDIFEAGHVGSLWKIRHPRTDSTINESIDANESTSAIDCEGDYMFTTHGTWTGTIKLERTLDGSTYETVFAISSVNDDNADEALSEPDEGYQYRITGTNWTSGTANCDLIVYEHMHTGIVRIASYVDPNEVTATVYTTLGGTSATYYWSEGYWSPKNGYPRTIAFHEFRLWYGGNSAYPQTIWSTETDEYEEMAEGTDDNDAIIYILPGQNPIQWMLSHSYLMIGTLGGAGRLGEENEPMTPTSKPQYLQQARYGSDYQQAVLAGDAILYVQRGGQKVREFVYNLERDKFLAPDMTVLAEHITGDGIEGITFQSRPESILWCWLEDGNVASMTYNREQDVVSWAEHTFSGDVESMAKIPGDNEDEIWIMVHRTVDSNDVRYIERMKPWNWGSDDNDVFYVDSGLTWDGGTAVNISNVTKADPAVVTVSAWPVDGDGDNLADGDQIKILAVSGMTELNGNIYTIDDANTTGLTFSLDNSSGSANIDSSGYTAYSSGGTVQGFENTFTNFSHLEGETIAICSDMVADANETVSSGSFTADSWSNVMHAGLPYTSTIETMPVAFNWNEGSTLGQYKDLNQVDINFYKSLGAKYGIRGDMEDVDFDDTDLYTGWIDFSYQHGSTIDCTVCVQQSKALPLTIRAMVLTVSVNK